MITPREFCFWLQGHLAGHSTAQTIMNKLKEVDLSIPERPPSVFPNITDTFRSTQDVFKNCPKCGLALSGVMSYSCSQINCPTGLGSPMC